MRSPHQLARKRDSRKGKDLSSRRVFGERLEEKDKYFIIIRRMKTDSLEEKYQEGNLVEIDAPEVFSIINNSTETLNFFKKIVDTARGFEPVLVQMEKVTHIGIDALIYYIVTLHKCEAICGVARVKGTFPKNEKVKKFLSESGFLNFHTTDPENIIRSGDIIEISGGNNADNEVSRKMCQFTQDKLGLTRLPTRGIYNILLELMLNTSEHAYTTNNNHFDRWLAFARYDKKRDKITFTFCDTGYGIPTTVKKNRIEQFWKWVDNFGFSSLGSDHQLVSSALKGAFRTKTELGYRGKGLPTIYKFAKSGYIQDLVILSNRARLNFSKDGVSGKSGEDSSEYSFSSNDMEENFEGTLFSWSVDKNSLSQT